MLAAKNPYIGSAYQQLQIISQDKQKRLEYEAREKALRDYNQLMAEAEQRGLKQGLEKGLEKGIQKGIRELILDNLEEQIPEERILLKLQKRFQLTEDKARQYYKELSKT